MRTIITNPLETGMNVGAQSGTEISKLVSRITAVSNGQNFQTKTVAQIKSQYGIEMTRAETRLWRKNRNQALREEKRNKALLRKNQLEAKKEVPTLTLLHLSNQELCDKIIELDQVHRRYDLRGKAATNQLVRAVNILAPEALEAIVTQIKSFSQQQKVSAQHAIHTIIGIRNALRSNQRDQVSISQLSDTDLRSEFSELYNSKAAQEWMPIVEKLIFGKLDKLENKVTILQFQLRVQRLGTSKEFTQKIKDHVLECIKKYIDSKFK